MSNSLETRAKKPESKRVLKPKLRFPEFRNADGWKNKRLGSYLEDCSTRVQPDTDLPVYSSTREGLRRQDDYFDGRVLLNENEYGVVPHGCFVYRHMSDDGLFKFNINETGRDMAVSKEYPVFRTRDLNSVFLLNKLNEGPDFKQFALSQKAGGTRTRLYFSKLCEWETLLPSLTEQQKIAECLTSLYELIAALGQKLDILRVHRKGLMQQLFPRDHELIPRLRFPEFQDAGEWRATSLGKLIQLQSGFAFSSDYFGSKGEKLVTPKNFTKFGFGNFEDTVSKYTTEEVSPKYICNPGDLLVLLTDLTPTCELLGKPLEVAEKDGNVLLNQRVAKVEPVSNEVTKSFLKYYFLTETYNDVIVRTATGSTVKHSSNRVILNMEVVFPLPEEQQRIADCLSSLDDLIAAQIQKLDALKTHKKGLMQQLFPSPEEIEA